VSGVARAKTDHHAFLGVGLIAGTLMIFQQPLRYLFDVAEDIEIRYHIDLIPALTVLSVVFVFHQYRKRQQAKAEAVMAATEARQARERAEELECLVAFGRALAHALTLSALRHVLWRHLPRFTQERDVWVLVQQAGRWEALLDDAVPSAHGSFEALEALAVRASQQTAADGHVEGMCVDDCACFPMVVAGQPVGVMGIHGAPALSPGQRRALGAAAALIAITVRNLQLFLESRENSFRDDLTGCFNRGHALTTLDAELRQAKRAKLPLSVLMLDVDDFKGINDQHGHLAGDRVLAVVSRQLTHVLRSTDFKCRYGGDEFLVILRDTPSPGAAQIAESLRREIATVSAPSGGRNLQITASIGVATAVPGELDVMALLARADEALYQAKRAGRNRWCVAAPARPTATGEPVLKLVQAV
jgi:diguanylate cyclase (GGDEF)-like protein